MNYFPPEWLVSPAPVAYPDAMAAMENRVEAVIAGEKPELIWLLEHPPLYTAGTSADPAELKDARFPVFEAGRGGRYTYHGPGQRVIYAVTDLRERGKDLRQHIWRLEEWIIRVLAEFGVKGERREGRVGIWVVRDIDDIRLPSPSRGGVGEGGIRPGIILDNRHSSFEQAPTPHPRPRGAGESVVTEEKIAAIGVRVRKWVAYHGLSLNVEPDLSHFSGIVPCGIAEFGVTSLRKLGVTATMGEVDGAFRQHLGSFSYGNTLVSIDSFESAP